MTLIDEFSRECLAIRVARKINGLGVLETTAKVMMVRGVPEHIRSDSGPEMTSKAVRNWLTNVGAQTLYIEPGSPWENGYCESCNSKLRDELLNAEIFYSLREAQVLIEQWRNHYNTLRPHSALGYRPPAPQTVRPNIIHLDHAARSRYLNNASTKYPPGQQTNDGQHGLAKDLTAKQVRRPALRFLAGRRSGSHSAPPDRPLPCRDCRPRPSRSPSCALDRPHN